MFIPTDYASTIPSYLQTTFFYPKTKREDGSNYKYEKSCKKLLVGGHWYVFEPKLPLLRATSSTGPWMPFLVSVVRTSATPSTPPNLPSWSKFFSFTIQSRLGKGRWAQQRVQQWKVYSPALRCFSSSSNSKEKGRRPNKR